MASCAVLCSVADVMTKQCQALALRVARNLETRPRDEIKTRDTRTKLSASETNMFVSDQNCVDPLCSRNTCAFLHDITEHNSYNFKGEKRTDQ